MGRYPPPDLSLLASLVSCIGSYVLENIPCFQYSFKKAIIQINSYLAFFQFGFYYDNFIAQSCITLKTGHLTCTYQSIKSEQLWKQDGI